MDEPSTLLGRLTRVVAATTPDAPLTHRLCLALAEISGLDGGSMTVGSSAPSRITLCATDDIAERIEQLQDLVREGPGIEAQRLGELIDADRTEIARRWPMLVQSLTDDLTPARLVAAPMRPDSEVLGVVTLYGATGPAITIGVDEIQFLANAIGVAVLGGFERSDGTDELWSARDLLNQATGMVVAQLGGHPADALAVLQAHAFAHETSVATIAAAVVERSLTFQPDPQTGRNTMDESDED
jgi:hypothetical protein